MKKKHLSLLILSVIASTMLSGSTIRANDINKQYTTLRLSGNNRYETSVKISNEYKNDTEIQGVVLALGENFPDALSGSVLSNKFKMPIVLSGADVKSSQTAISYIEKNLSKDRTIYILGGIGGIKTEVEEKLKDLGYTTKRLGGKDRFDTNSEIVKEFDVKEGTPVVIASGENFPDALSISSVAGAKGYPILLVTNNNLPDNAKHILEAIKPSKAFIIGGTASVSDKNINNIKTITGLDNNAIIRLGGKDRFETSLSIAKYFNLEGDTVTFANGDNFPDALSGSALSSLKNAPLVLINNNDVSKQKKYIDNTNYINQIFYGGSGVISDSTINKLSSTRNEIIEEETKGKDYIKVSIDKDYKGINTIVPSNKIWTLTFSEPVDVQDLDIKIGGYGQRNGVPGYYFYSEEAQKEQFVFQQSAPNQIRIIKGQIRKWYDIDENYTGEESLCNDGYYNGTYRIVIGKNSKTKSGKTIGKDYIFQYKTTGATGLKAN